MECIIIRHGFVGTALLRFEERVCGLSNLLNPQTRSSNLNKAVPTKPLCMYVNIEFQILLERVYTNAKKIISN